MSTTSIELAKSIYEIASLKSKQAWLSQNQEKFLFSLLEKEGRLDRKAQKHHIATIIPDGTWRNDLTIGEAIKIGKETNIDSYDFKKVYVVNPPFYIKREGFRAKKIIII